eukprot:GHVT01101614.1.p1 GENE.GHVT01101614.1~~GHVT01101614.1.p1  ORF type:complete len:180 (-),score=10.32 GHVT01101614.1:667-1140(-)
MCGQYPTFYTYMVVACTRLANGADAVFKECFDAGSANASSARPSFGNHTPFGTSSAGPFVADASVTSLANSNQAASENPAQTFTRFYVTAVVFGAIFVAIMAAIAINVAVTRGLFSKSSKATSRKFDVDYKKGIQDNLYSVFEPREEPRIVLECTHL